MRTDRLRGQLDLLLLGTLADAPGHGYEVITALRERTDGFLDLSEGSVYPALHRLEELGWLRSDWHPVSGRRRRVYSLTTAGRDALQTQSREWTALRTAVEAILRPLGLPAGGPA